MPVGVVMFMAPQHSLLHIGAAVELKVAMITCIRLGKEHPHKRAIVAKPRLKEVSCGGSQDH